MKQLAKTGAGGAERWAWRMFVVVLVAGLIVITRDFRWGVVMESAPFLLKGLGTSWALAVISISVGALAAIPLAWARVYGPKLLRLLAVGIIEGVRAIPELMIVFWFYYAIPPLLDLPISAWGAGTAALSLLATVYLAEVIRGGIFSVRNSQWDAAFSLGLTPMKTFVLVVMPQALRNMVPALIAQLIMLFKATALVYVIGVVEFFRAVTLISNSTFAPFALYSTLAIGYFICCWSLSALVRKYDPEYRVGL